MNAIESLPEFHEVAARARIETDISDHLLTIFREALAARPRLIVELGVRSGESTFVLERVARLTGATLVSLDIEDCSRVSPWPRWHFVRSDDVAFAQQFRSWCEERGIEPRIDVLFVDTSHEYEHTRRELEAWVPHLAPTGRMLFHDTNLKRTLRRRDGRVLPWLSEQLGVTRALEEFLGAPLNETRDGTFERNGWAVRHDSCCHGFTVLERRAAAGTKGAAIVFCERLDNESFCESIVRELGAWFDVRPCGPGWHARDLAHVETAGALFYLELDAASGSFVRPQGLETLAIPKFAWLIDTHKKPVFHAEIARQMDLTFYAHKVWGHVFQSPARWLPLHADQAIFRPVAAERDLDVVFVGSQEWRADPLRRIAEKHGLRIAVRCTTGPREKSETAALYARAKLVFNRHCANDLNFRVCEAMAAGRVVLTDAQWNGQYELFEDGKHYVLYKDERDLERQVLHYLQDDRARARIEAEAAALAAREHTTRQRVGQLVAAIQDVIAPPDQAVPTPEPLPAQARRKGRWLFFAGDEPATVERATYAERLASSLARDGHDVVVTRARRGVLPARASRGPLVLEVDEGPFRDALTVPNTLLVQSTAVHVACDRIAREHGPFDMLVGEGALGGLALEPVARRLERPFVLALEACEVSKRGNRLTREQLNLAELEHWFAERAAAVLAPSPEVSEAVKSFYKTQHAQVVPSPWPRLLRAPEVGRLALRLGLEPRGYVVVLSRQEGERESAALLRGATTPLVLVGQDVRLARQDGDVVVLGSARGRALGELMVSAAAVVALDRADPRVLEAMALGCPLSIVDATHAVARGASFLTEAAASAQPAGSRATGNEGVLDALLALLPQKEAELAVLQ